MKMILAIAERELRERFPLMTFGAAVAVIPFLAALLPTAGANRLGTIGMLGAVLSMALGLGTAIVLGVSMISGELSHRRISFDFSRPIGSAVIWFGKLGAAILASSTVFAIIALPSFLASGPAWPLFAEGTRTSLSGWTVAAIVVLVLLSHTVASLVRSRSALVALDFVLFFVASGIVALLTWLLLLGDGVSIAETLGRVMGFALLLTLALAPIGQLERGRTDIVGSHAALSLTLWPAVAVILLLASVFVTWVVSVEPADLHEAEAHTSPGGDAAFISGLAPNGGDYDAAFLVDTKTGAYVRLRSLSSRGAWSRDGRVFAWLERTHLLRRREPEAELRVRTAGGEIQNPSLRVRNPARLAVSDDGGRIAIHSEQTLSVYDTSRRRVLAAVRLPERNPDSIWFLSPDLIRMVIPETKALSSRIVDFDVGRRRLIRRTAIRHADDRSHLAVSAGDDRSRVLLRRQNRIVDVTTGRTLSTVGDPQMTWLGSTMLHDGRVVRIPRRDGGVGRLQLYTPDGEVAREIVLRMGRYGVINGEIGGDRLIVTTYRLTPAGTRDPAVHLVSLSNGAIEQTHEGFYGPLAHWDVRLPMYAPDSAIPLVNGEGRLMVWALDSGDVRLFSSR